MENSGGLGVGGSNPLAPTIFQKRLDAAARCPPFILNANLGIPEENQGKALGTLALWQEIALILVYGPLGALADKIGRRFVYFFGFLMLAAGYAIYPYATSLTELSLYRVIYAIGIGAATSTLSTVIADYARTEDRGKLTALCGFLNGLGVVLVILFIGKLPNIFVSSGASEIQAGRMTGAILAGFCFLSGLILWFGLRRGTTKAIDGKKPGFFKLITQGFAEARSNPRIALAYCAAFVARGDLAIVGLFAIAWGQQAARQSGMGPAEALEAGLVPFIIAQSAALFWPVFIAWPLDRLNRTLALVLCMALGAIGYCLLAFVDNPLAGASIPFFIILGIGQISAFLGAQTLISKEAPEALRGSVIGAFNFSGAIGILVLSYAGGWLFDHVAPWAPFMLVGILNGVIAVAGIVTMLGAKKAPVSA